MILVNSLFVDMSRYDELDARLIKDKLLVVGARPLTEDEQLYLRLLQLGECAVLVF